MKIIYLNELDLDMFEPDLYRHGIDNLVAVKFKSHINPNDVLYFQPK
jgi:hypothetical protein